MPNFANSKIYKLYSNNLPDIIYIGSTTQTLNQRLSKHVCHAKSKHNASRQIIEAGDFYIDELEAYPCASLVEMRMREQHWMNNHVCCNKHRAFRTKEEKKEQKRVQAVKDNIKRLKKVQCFCGGKYLLKNKAQHYKSKKHQAAAVEIISMV
tara:strand:- start:57 stop:512 length:456 start_codon:yes stop_codon:yes gene_type:complete